MQGCGKGTSSNGVRRGDVAGCGHKALSVNTLNCDCDTQVLDCVKASPYIKSISLVSSQQTFSRLGIVQTLCDDDTGMWRSGRLRAMRLLDGGRDGHRVPFLPRDHPRRPQPESRQVIKVKPKSVIWPTFQSVSSFLGLFMP